MKIFFRFAAIMMVCAVCVSSCKFIAKEAGGEVMEKTIKELIQTGGSRSLKEISTSNALFRTLFDGLERTVSKDFADGITVSSIGKEILELSSKEFPNSRIILNLKNRTIECSAGSLKNSGPVNEFLNVLLPNMTYKVDDCFTYVTDKYGRVIKAYADRSKASTLIQRNPQRNTNIQKMVVDKLDGTPGVHDAGHLFSNTTGGPNELINQVPMTRNVNRSGGKWREMEKIEEDAIAAGKHVISQREPLYKGISKCPYAIKNTYIIDGKKMTTIIKI